MVADSSISDGERVWSGRKVYRLANALIGLAGDWNEAIEFLKWWKSGQPDKRPKFTNSQALVLTDRALVSYNISCSGERVARGIEAIGSGAKAAICAYEALAWTDPKLAVRIVCRHDSGSRSPVRVYKL